MRLLFEMAMTNDIEDMKEERERGDRVNLVEIEIGMKKWEPQGTISNIDETV